MKASWVTYSKLETSALWELVTIYTKRPNAHFSLYVIMIL